MRITTPSPESSEEEQDISQEPVPKGSKAMMRRLRDKFKEMAGVIYDLIQWVHCILYMAIS